MVVNQLPFSMLNRHAEDTMAWCKAHDIGIITYGSLGSGLLSGKVRVNPKYEITDVRGRFYGKYYEDEMFAKIMRLVDTLDAIAQARGVPISQVAVNWSAQHPLVDSPIMGVRTRAHALENTAAMDWTLTPEEIARIDSRIDETVGRGADVIHKTHVQKK